MYTIELKVNTFGPAFRFRIEDFKDPNYPHAWA